jgi:hypothetical protein
MRKVSMVVAAVVMSASANAMSLDAVKVDWPALAAKTVAVCNGSQVKSAKLTEACKTGQMPNVLKDGTRYYNVGIGAELNTLMRQ